MPVCGDQRPLRDEIVERQQDVPDVEDNGLYLGHGEKGK